ncbi:conserved hypothetical protein [Vibrio nigripulchritudo SFn27]|uniref:Beta-lactamase n=1 Tax=Vibrio nigripulchritudo TaxID=28173 RepID=U4KDL9_9VIBR|nr:hypothetical protein [Vibrio nigripulchritudo]CCN80941.1 conserved hypothetical protein [Vibrio nigripulchritudo BLFn1]CCN89214.1 conserved hypothetical protein [Vibrio nigripulchritudo SFn27]CCN96670.1 conserved hypothetical protein [Vibrio nigripulchritudo ENn2]CCO39559.1 conserved hypothetical protein [Vibrio nigripulchritudo SFn135]CCO55951.1 conserved hypothetical protein [Vibrio nigripulchritudo Wn13]
MKIAKPLILSVLIPPVALASELSSNWDWMISADTTQHQATNGVFTSDEESIQSVDALLEVELGYQSFNGSLALLGNDIYHSESSVNPESDLIIRELFWQGSVDLAGTTLDATVGKIRQDYGVGYGYRPLDVFNPYRRNPVGIQVEEGVGVVSLSHFGAEGEWTAIATTSSLTQQETTEIQKAAQQHGVGVRYYGLRGDSEFQVIGYFDDVRKGLVGASWVTVFGSEWEWHSSAVIQRKHLAYHHPNQLLAPVVLETQGAAQQVMTGITWSSFSGHSVIAEYWYDSRAWGKEEWEDAQVSATSLRETYGQDRLADSYGLGLTNANLTKHNVMFHWTLDTQNWQGQHWTAAPGWFEKLTPTVDLMIAPEDGGVISTPRLSFEWYDDGSSRFETELAARFYNGKDKSLYKNLKTNSMILLNFKGRF